MAFAVATEASFVPVRQVLVIPATGKQGSKVCDELLEKGFTVFGTSRSIHNPKLTEKGITPIEFAYGDALSAETAIRLSHADAVFFATDFHGAARHSGARETEHGKTIIDACKKLNVGYVVFSSVADADKVEDLSSFKSKHAIEDHMKETLANTCRVS